MQKLFLVHVGYYDANVADGVYENHTNLFIAAESFEEARAKAKELPEYKKRKMHVDGLQLIEAVEGYRVTLKADPKVQTQISSQKGWSRMRKPTAEV